MAIIRDRKTGRIVGVTKERPDWATEENLRRIILMPALRHYTATLQFFRQGRSSIERLDLHAPKKRLDLRHIPRKTMNCQILCVDVLSRFFGR
jgi:hypothetical protein